MADSNAERRMSTDEIIARNLASAAHTKQVVADSIAYMAQVERGMNKYTTPPKIAIETSKHGAR